MAAVCLAVILPTQTFKHQVLGEEDIKITLSYIIGFGKCTLTLAQAYFKSRAYKDNMLRKQNLPGIYVIPSAQTSLVWFGVIFVRQGLYQGAVFRFNIYLPENFPDGGCPRVVLLTPVFHPMVNMDTGEMDVKSGFQEWRKNVNHIWQVLQYVRRAFYKVETRSPLNKEASELYEKDQEAFQERVQNCVKSSLQHIYDPPTIDDPHYISFDPYDEELHGPVRESIFKSQDDDSGPCSVGLSWVQPGSLQPFSKPNVL